MDKFGSILGTGLFLGVFAVYLHGAYPTVAVGDAGEFITAATTLGVPHPPGFPAYIIPAHVFETIVPWANPGFKINLFSAALGAFAVWILFQMLRRAGAPVPVALAFGLFFAWAPAQLINSQTSEVFTLHLVFCAASLWAATEQEWVLSAFLLGLGASNHQTIVFIVPAIVFLFNEHNRQRSKSQKLREIAFCGFFFALGLSLYLVPLIRAKAEPFLNIGHADNFHRWWRLLIRADFGSLTLALGEAPPRTLFGTGRQLARFVNGFAHQAHAAILLVTLIPFLSFLNWPFSKTAKVDSKEGKPVFSKEIMAFGIAFVAIGPAFFLLGNLPFDAQSNSLLERFYIVPMFCWLLGTGCVFAQRAAQWPFVSWLLPLISLIGLPTAISSIRRMDFRAYAYGENNLRTLPPHALFVMDGGDDTFYTLAYLTHCEHRREDIELHDRGGVVFPKLYGDDFRQLPGDEKEQRRRETEQALATAGRPLFFSTMNRAIFGAMSYRQSGILYHVMPSSAPAFSWNVYDLRGIAPWTASSFLPLPDYRTRALVPFYAFQRAVETGDQNLWLETSQWIASAHQLAADCLWLSPNILVSLHQWGYRAAVRQQWNDAARFYQLLTAWYPTNTLGWSNLGSVYQKMGQLGSAINCLEKAITLDPNSAAAHFNLATALWSQARWPQVIQELEVVLQLNPQYPGGAAFLAQARRHVP